VFVLTVVTQSSICQLFYGEATLPSITTHPASNDTNTNSIAQSTVGQFCLCDFTVDACDPLCCCDYMCTATEVDYWKTTFNHVCDTASTKSSQLCYKDSYFYRVNKRKGLIELAEKSKQFFCDIDVVADSVSRLK